MSWHGDGMVIQRRVAFAVLLIGLTCSVAVCGNGEKEHAEGVRRWLREHLLGQADHALRSRAVAENKAERDEIVSALLEVGGSAHLRDVVRGQAILGLVDVATEPALRFCAEHVTLVLVPPGFGRSESYRLSAACRTVLEEAGWPAVPFILKRLGDEATPEADSRDLAYALGRVCGKEMAVSMISALGSAEGKALPDRARIEALVRYVREYMPTVLPPRPPR